MDRVSLVSSVENDEWTWLAVMGVTGFWLWKSCLFFFFKQKTAYEIGLGIPAEPLFRSTSRLSLSKHLAHNLGNLLLLGKIGVFHNRRNASSRLLLLISKHLILCIYLVFRILA